MEFFRKVFEFKNICDLEITGQPQSRPTELKIPELDNDFTILELNKAIKKLSKNKEPWNDGIANEIWKFSTHEFKLDFLQCINQMFNCEKFPDNWSEIVIVPLHKKNDPKLPEDYRPVSLVNTAPKLFTIMLGNRLNKWNLKSNKISDYQAAYKKGNGCMDHIFVLTSALQHNVHEKNREVFALFVGLSQAFDTVQHEVLWKKLNDKGLSSKFINIVRTIYSKAKARNRTNYAISDWFPIESGVLQGETISPMLWNLYLEDVVKEFDESETIPIKFGESSIHILLYADDIILLGYTIGELQKKINILKNYFEKYGLRVNLKKTKYIIFSKAL